MIATEIIVYTVPERRGHIAQDHGGATRIGQEVGAGTMGQSLYRGSHRREWARQGKQA